MAKATKKSSYKVKVEPIGEAHIKASFNNIIISLTNATGQVISWSSAGKMGFRGSKKNTPYAAQTAAEDAANLLWEFNIAEKNDAKLINNKKGKVILVKLIAKSIFSRSSMKPGAIIDTNPGIKIWTTIVKIKRPKNKKLKILFANSFALFFPLIISDV